MSLVFNMVGGGGGGIKLESIAITTAPTKTAYVVGDSFDTTGMIVTATYTNGAKLNVTGYTYSPSGALSDGDTSITISYTEKGVTKTATQSITVAPKLTAIAVTTAPTKTTYEYLDTFSASGMAVTATYSDGSTASITGYTYSPTSLTTVGTQAITVSYTETGVTKTATTNVTVNRKSISTTPSQSGTLTYTGSSLSPSWSNYNTTQLTISGTTSGTNAGNYTAAFTPTANYRWSDGTTTAKSVTWSIGKASGSLSISPTSMTLDTTTKSKTITVTRAGNGTVSASSSNTTAATVSVSGTTVTVTGKANGSATITVSVAAGTNHTAPSSKTCAVTVNFISDTFSANSWDVIIEACQSGSVPSAWAVGDSKTMTIDGASYQVDIIGKNHDTYADGGTAPLTFQLHDCLSTKSTWVTNYDSKISIMPSNVQSAIKSVSKPTEGSNVSMKLFLLSEYEVFGAKTNAAVNDGKQYAYYSAGNSKIKKVSGSAAVWWLRSRYRNSNHCCVSPSGSAVSGYNTASYGISFGFCF